MLSKETNIVGGRVVNKPNQINFQGLSITIENPEGSVREWKSEEGKGRTLMYYKYGYINGTVGVDGEEVDCFIGNDPYAPMVYVIRLGKDDREEKIMFGFTSQDAARDAFLAHYQSSDFLGTIIEMPMHLFKETLE